MLNRREAIRSAILGLGAASVPAKLYNQLVKDERLAARLEGAKNDQDAYWKLVKLQFKFEDNIRYFNHASLGASPLTVIDATEMYRRTLESYPSKYMWGGWDDQIEIVREKAALLLNAEAEEIALIHNTTEGMNIVANSLDLDRGDEVIIGNHEHRTGTSPWLYHQERKGVKIVRPELPLIPNSSEDILEVYDKAITNRTKAISMVHMTNTNGMILPVKEICSLARDRGIITLIDGAQSMGTILCDVREIGCDFYTASGHKWLFSPKGIGIFYARDEHQELLKPLIANRAYDQPGLKKIEDYNTRNLPDVLGLGAALEFHDMIGLDRRMQRTLELRELFLSTIAEDDGFEIKTPLDENLSHQILTVEKKGMNVGRLKDQLIDEYKIDVRGMFSHGLNGVRISFSIYHDEDDVMALVNALKTAG